MAINGMAAEAEAIIVATSSLLSLFGSGAIMVSYALWPRIRTTSRLVLVFLSFADFMAAAGYGAAGLAILMPNYQMSKFECIFQSVITTWSSAASFCWTVALATYLYITVVRDGLDRAKRLLPTFVIVCTLIPTAVVVGGAFSHALGEQSGHYTTSGWCWISEKPQWPVFNRNVTDNERYYEARLFWMLLGGKFWEFSACFIIFFLYVRIRRHVRHQTRVTGKQFLTSGSKTAVMKADRKMIIVPLAFVALRIWGCVRFIIDSVNRPEFRHREEGKAEFLAYLQAVGDTGQGFVNFLIFCWGTESIRKRLIGCCCRCQSATEDSETSSLLGKRKSSDHVRAGVCYGRQNNSWPVIGTTCDGAPGRKSTLHHSVHNTDDEDGANRTGVNTPRPI